MLVTVIEQWNCVMRTYRTRANCLEGNYPTVGPRMLDGKLSNHYLYIACVIHPAQSFQAEVRTVLELLMVWVYRRNLAQWSMPLCK